MSPDPQPSTEESVEEPSTRQSLRRAAAGRRPAIAQAAGEQFSLAEAVGGPRGVVEAVLPGLLFVVWFTATRDLQASLTASLGAAALLVVARVVQRTSVNQALGGLLGVAVCAWAAGRTGDAVDFYAPGLLINVAYGAVYALSTLRWPRIGPLPIIGLLIGPLVGEGVAWRRDPARLRVYRQVTWLWVGLFAVRLAVQLPLYFSGAVAALGVARLVMGIPLFALTVWLSWVLLRRVPKAQLFEPASAP